MEEGVQHGGSSGKALGVRRIEKSAIGIKAKGNTEATAQEEKQGGSNEGAVWLTVSKLEAPGAVASHSVDRRPAL